MDRVISELCYKGIILQRNYSKMTQKMSIEGNELMVEKSLLLIIYANSLDPRSVRPEKMSGADTRMVFEIDFFHAFFVVS